MTFPKQFMNKTCLNLLTPVHLPCHLRSAFGLKSILGMIALESHALHSLEQTLLSQGRAKGSHSFTAEV